MATNLMKNVLSFSLPRNRQRWLTTLTSLNVAPQQQASLAERCIVIDSTDKAVGEASKLDCHLVKDGKLLLHRAFSVFLFNNKNELLVQQRSPEKITFPNCYTNACCSHPLFDFPKEQEEKDAIGVRIAAQRRLNYELGIPKEEAKPDFMTYLTRIHYQGYEDRFGEHEIDYILILKGDVTLQPNPDEVSDVRYIPQSQFDSWIRNMKDPLTPWFKLIIKHKLLHKWWDNLDNLENLKDHKNILRYC